MIQKILTNATKADWTRLLANADEIDGATLIGPGWTARRCDGYILLRGEAREVNKVYAELCG